ncbi:hypothetical protein Syun_005510 [Stephania yunnanensis]|uniref:ornithine decarboxylase n=1 Tax=Stephania yunnanensis TaxID=152371 RepID=A0AAP0L4X1_9MAGN
MGSYPISVHALINAPALKGKTVTSLSRDGLEDFVMSKNLKTQELEEPFFLLDLGTVVSLMNKWTRSLPSIQPFYAVKCNPNPAFLSALAALGASFDCASKAEIEAILALSVSADRIVFANTCKANAHIRYAASVGVNLATFDSIEEVEKIGRWHPKCALLLRIKPLLDDGVARFPLGAKFGALPEEVVPLLQAARAARLNVAGVSFHVGSVVLDSTAYRGAIAAARAVFDTATELGMPKMNILDMGGGFTAGSQFDETAAIIKAAVNTYFDSELPGLRVIAEPGRFFAETSFTLVANIIGKRVRGTLREYWINDGIYRSMNCIIHNDVPVTAIPFACASNSVNPTCREAQTFISTVFGPTCDPLDTVLREYQLPEMQVNDWLVFPNMGAYAAACGSSFNGFKTSAITTHLVITPAIAN